MRVVIAPQAFKGSLSAREACRAMKEGLHRALPEAEGVLVPMADGGDGTLEALVEISGGRYITTLVTGPQGDAVEATWGLIESDATAVIEMARASGLVLLAGRPLDPRTATSRGTGELILAALDRGARHIILAWAAPPPTTAEPGWPGPSARASWTARGASFHRAARPLPAWNGST